MNEKIKRLLSSVSSPLVLGAGSIVCGILLAIFGLGVFNVLIWVIGVGTIIVGGVRLYQKMKFYKGEASPLRIALDCVPILVGVMLMVFKSGVLASLINIIGIIICVWSVYRLARLLANMPQNKSVEFWYEVVSSAILLAVAAVLLLFPGIAELLGGIILVLVGVELIRAHIYTKKHTTDGKNIYEAEFRDITDKDNGKNN